ncbi:hypothetical protein OAE25_03125, partial [Verrucomicrobiales bacterium]|nr:hypothetical protein [Verrucomicrobiales bacterium]
HELLGRRSGSTFVACGSKALTSALAKDAITPRAQAVDVDSKFARYLRSSTPTALKQLNGISAELFCVGFACV